MWQRRMRHHQLIEFGLLKCARQPTSAEADDFVANALPKFYVFLDQFWFDRKYHGSQPLRHLVPTGREEFTATIDVKIHFSYLLRHARPSIAGVVDVFFQKCLYNVQSDVRLLMQQLWLYICYHSFITRDEQFHTPHSESGRPSLHI